MQKVARWALALAVVTAVACSSGDDDDGTRTSGSGAQGTGASGGTGPSAGGAGGDGAAGDCGSCAEASCADDLDACLADEGCAAWWECVQGCGSDAACPAGCGLQHLAAEELYLAVDGCLCSSCGRECASLSPCDVSPCVDEDLPLMTAPPATLAETGLYADDGELAEYVQHFVPQFQLWSDDAAKQRWAYLPKCSQIDTSDMDHWELPVGARLWKEFTRDGVRVETRLIHRFGPGANDWIFAAYQWDDAQTTATHVPDGVPNASGTPHDIPSELQCKNCHTKLAERALGFSAVQLSYAVDTGDVSMASLSAGGRLTVPAPDGFPVPGDDTAKLALGYLHANCGNCHNDTGVLVVDMSLRLLVDDATVQDTNVWQTAVGKTATLFSCAGCERIEPGFPEQSAIIMRMSVRGTNAQMPPIGTEVVHQAGVDTVSEWISTLTACSSEGEACDGTIGCCGGSCVNQVCVDSCTAAGAACTANTDCCTGVCGADSLCACSGDFEPCAAMGDCCGSVMCDTENGLCL